MFFKPVGRGRPLHPLQKKRQLILSPCEDMATAPVTARCVFREVLSLELLFLRVVSGCADGKIRVFNYLTGSCLRVLVGSSRGDPISFCAAKNRLVTTAAVRPYQIR